jgi:hypothetical protein
MTGWGPSALDQSGRFANTTTAKGSAFTTRNRRFASTSVTILASGVYGTADELPGGDVLSATGTIALIFAAHHRGVIASAPTTSPAQTSSSPIPGPERRRAEFAVCPCKRVGTDGSAPCSDAGRLVLSLGERSAAGGPTEFRRRGSPVTIATRALRSPTPAATGDRRPQLCWSVRPTSASCVIQMAPQGYPSDARSVNRSTANVARPRT